ncbi:hypothetical protein VCRA2116O30_20287 [Vibrio crassostreae]|nr:hypothetical protein VCRA2116O30_20287 [Vibrio crassostreae]CAK2070473.1 hypothetical protein VCRA2113O20_30029 [Vibrio crassostreae]CAK2091793.1 hypothetical protein VCRA2119O45_30288 [Vibrio crassostreae]CAK2149540.1 hypothetical protein VCRA2117O39_40288 [Vibrio crassostreae]CAK2366845.1 hypothetical protein VCRA2119O49_40029 [Vibrio crassostreae]
MNLHKKQTFKKYILYILYNIYMFFIDTFRGPDNINYINEM